MVGKMDGRGDQQLPGSHYLQTRAFWKVRTKRVDRSLPGENDVCSYMESENTGKCF